ncbi:GBP1 [Symbiodinium sp. KB8]|nr:GBP1 [Symbiodinium sp. KB8]
MQVRHINRYFIYNSMGAIDEQVALQVSGSMRFKAAGARKLDGAIDDLHLVLHIAKHIHVKSHRRNEEEKSSDLSQYFPLFLWVLRDFHLRLADESGAPISEKEYLERALQSVRGQEEKNRLRDVIKDLFRERDCATIVRPVVDEADLRNIQKLWLAALWWAFEARAPANQLMLDQAEGGQCRSQAEPRPYESLRPEFREQAGSVLGISLAGEAFVKKVYMFLKPKKIDGQLVNGAMLVELAGEYCKAINSGVVPTIQSAWTSVVQHQLRLSLRDAVQTYRSRMNETAMQNLPLSEEKLRELHKEAKAEGLKLLLNARLDADPRFRESRAQFSSRVRQLFGHVTAENQSASQRQCDRLAHELYKPVEQKVLASGTYTSFHELAADWDRLRQAYLQKALGPAKAEVLLGRLGSQLLQSAQKVWEDFHTAGEERSQALKKQLADAEARFLGLKGSAEERSSHGIGVEVARRMELERLLEDARRSLTEATQKFAREKAQLMDSERTLREQMKILQDRAPAESRRSGLELPGGQVLSEIQGLKDTVLSMVSELRSKDMERGQLEMRAEHEKQLIALERRFSKQLAEARQTSEISLEGLRKGYEQEVETLKNEKMKLSERLKEAECQLQLARSEVQAQASQLRQAEATQRQSQLVFAFLEKCSDNGGKDVDDLRDELRSFVAKSPCYSLGRPQPLCCRPVVESRGKDPFRFFSKWLRATGVSCPEELLLSKARLLIGRPADASSRNLATWASPL